MKETPFRLLISMFVLTLRSLGLGILLSGLLLGTAFADRIGVYPPQSHAYDKSLSEWMIDYNTWYLNLNGQPQTLHYEDHVLFLPTPLTRPVPVVVGQPGTLNVGTLKLELRQGTPFVFPVLGLTGESYVDDKWPPDEPADWITNSLLSATIEVKLDGKVIMASPGDNAAFKTGPTYFEPPINYVPPQFRYNDQDLGEIKAASAIWIEQIGFVHTPLAVGHHTLHIYAFNNDLGFGFDYTWRITVKQ